MAERLAVPVGLPSSRRAVTVLGYPVDSLTMDEAVERVAEFVRSGRPHQITAINASKVVRADRDPRLRQVLLDSEMVISEYAILWASRRLGRPLAAHVGGIMLMKCLIEAAPSRGHRVYFLGARPGVVVRLVERLRARYPSLAVVGCRDGYFDPSVSSEVTAAIRNCGPDILFVAMGTPRQEFWIRENMHHLGVPVLMGVGGSFDVLAGLRRETPAWMRHGLEWAYRLAQDPKNLWRRYLTTNPAFVLKVAKARLGRTV